MYIYIYIHIFIYEQGPAANHQAHRKVEILDFGFWEMALSLGIKEARLQA